MGESRREVEWRRGQSSGVQAGCTNKELANKRRMAGDGQQTGVNFDLFQQKKKREKTFYYD